MLHPPEESRPGFSRQNHPRTAHARTCGLLGDELDGLGLGPEVLAGAVDPDVHALRDVIGLLQGKVPEEEEVE